MRSAFYVHVYPKDYKSLPNGGNKQVESNVNCKHIIKEPRLWVYMGLSLSIHSPKMPAILTALSSMKKFRLGSLPFLDLFTNHSSYGQLYFPGACAIHFHDFSGSVSIEKQKKTPWCLFLRSTQCKTGKKTLHGEELLLGGARAAGDAAGSGACHGLTA